MTELWKFLPASDGWEGTWTNVYYGIGTVTDTFDYNVFPNPSTCNVYAYRKTANAGPVKRLRCSFSLSALPTNLNDEAGGHTDIVTVAYSDDLSLDADDWNWNTTLFVLNDGRLTFAILPVQEISESGIAAGETYDLELVVDDTAGAESWKVYINGDLWLQHNESYPPYTGLAYLEVIEGMSSTRPQWHYGGASVTLHIGDHSEYGEHVWTIEGQRVVGPAVAGWSMMYAPF